MKNLFYMFIRTNKINPAELIEMSASKLSIEFNKWVKSLSQARNKTIVNEADKFMIRKWIVNGTFNQI